MRLLPLLLTLFALLTPPAFVACSAFSSPPPAVSVAGDVTNRAAPILVAIEESAGNAAIDRGEDPLATVAPKWAPFWAAWRAWVAAQRAWADAWERGATDAEQAGAAAHAALCAATSLLPPEVPREVVAVTGLACLATTTLATPAVADGGPDARVP